jgi:hypothetical protein
MFIANNSSIYMDNISATPINKIPVGNWVVQFDIERACFYIERAKKFKVPKKIYGSTKELAERYLTTFSNMKSNMGVLLTGLKGTGKSLTARYTAMKSNLPVIIVTEPYGGAVFNHFLSQIDQECVILFDEFEKVYHEEENQHKLLSVLDGVFSSKFLFLLTVNENSKMNSFFMNRPGRIRYSQHYRGLSDKVIKDVCNDVLNDKTKIKDIIQSCNYLGDVSMDIITSIITESNLYPQDAICDIVQIMNLYPEDASFRADVYANGDLIKSSALFDENPYSLTEDSEFTISWYGNNVFDERTEGDQWCSVYYNQAAKNARVRTTAKSFEMEFEQDTAFTVLDKEGKAKRQDRPVQYRIIVTKYDTSTKQNFGGFSSI